ncbi:MAG: dTDP-4-dehydrorhamnose reductase [Dehalococcoidia bacterium]
MRILITGARGQLGRSLEHAFAHHDVLALGRDALDVTSRASIDRALEDNGNGRRIDTVIHCAALTDTARCEREAALARSINGDASGSIGRACARAGARLVAISTNEVFRGDATAPYPEDAPTAPINAYGLSKLDGEVMAVATCADTLIVRTSWNYGDGATNFIEKVRAIAREGRPLRMVTDERSAPTSTADLAEAIRRLLEAQAPPGVYHLPNEGEASRYDWAREILRLDGMPDIHVEPVTTPQLRAEGYAGPHKPPYSVLANTRARALGIALRPWQTALAGYFERAKVPADG